MAENSGHIPRHKYSAEDIVTCLLLYVYCGCSYRSIPKALQVMRLRAGFEVGDLPDVTTVIGWVEKAGLAELQNKGKSLPESYAVVMDESISVGGFKLLLALGIPSENEGHATKHSETEVLGMEIGESFDSKDVEKMLQDVAEKVGRPPKYVISDGGTNLVNGISDSGIPRHRDVGHYFANCLKKVYGEDPDFKDLSERVGKTKHWSLDKDLAPLKAPNQRAIQRFMNIFPWMDWADKIIDAYYRMTPKEKLFLGFVQKHASLVEELSEVCRMIKDVMKVLKTHGLSLETARQCIAIIASMHACCSGRRFSAISDMLTRYISSELKLVEAEDKPHNITSDIIETCFGIYKARRSPDKMAGITTIILTMPLYSYMRDEEKWANIDIKGKFTTTTITDVCEWRKINLPDSPNKLRKQKLCT